MLRNSPPVELKAEKFRMLFYRSEFNWMVHMIHSSQPFGVWKLEVMMQGRALQQQRQRRLKQQKQMMRPSPRR
jgi:hypothetical protein